MIPSDVRIRKRIRSRVLPAYWHLKIFLLFLLVCLVGQPGEHSGVMLVVSASTVEESEDEVSVMGKKVGLTVKHTPKKPKTMTLNQILIKAGKRGLGGGLPGAIAGVVQVLSLMWLRYVDDR